MDYKETLQSGKDYVHIWDIDSTEQFDGGFLLDKSNLPVTLEKLPRGTFMKVDLVERKAKMIKTAKVYEAVTAEAILVKIEKGSLILATDVIGNGSKAIAVASVDQTDAAFDSFPIVAGTLGVLALGDKLQESSAVGANKAVVNPDGFTIAEVKIDAQPSCSVIFKAYGIVASKMPFVVTDNIKTALGKCQFV